MLLYERYKKFPIMFYKLPNGTIEYEGNFIKGYAKTIEEALNNFAKQEFIDDLFYYYDDVVDVKFGKYEPNFYNKKVKGKEYLGKLNLELDLNDFESNQSVKYLSKHKEEIPIHLDNIQKEKLKAKKERIKQDIKDKIMSYVQGIKNMFKKPITEMFTPYKATQQHVCKHCGVNIEIGTYFEEYRNNAYHIECIWDKLINNKQTNSYEEAQKFFFSLKNMIGNWPAYGYDVEDDYISDLELVEHNNRLLHRKPTLEEFKKLNEEFERILNDRKETI